MSIPILLKNILLDNNRLSVCPYSSIHILWYSRKLYITKGTSEVFIRQFINGLNLIQFQSTILIQRILLIILQRELRSISYLLIDAVHDIISNNIALLNLLRFTTSLAYQVCLLCSGQDTVHLHRTSNHPRVSLRVRVGTIHIIAISRQMFQASQ